jgi:hypothetical protein
LWPVTLFALFLLGQVAAGLFGVVLWFGVLNDLLFPKAQRPADLLLPWICRNLLGICVWATLRTPRALSLTLSRNSASFGHT